jgi:hypothetical protein
MAGNLDVVPSVQSRKVLAHHLATGNIPRPRQTGATIGNAVGNELVSANCFRHFV